MDGRTLHFSAEHCLKYHIAFASLPSSHSVFWCHVFPGCDWQVLLHSCRASIRRDIKSYSVLEADVIVFAHQLDIASHPDSSANTDVLALPSLDSWDVPRCTDWLLLWLPSCCLVLDHSQMFSRSPACPPSNTLRLTQDTSQCQTSNRHPPMTTHFSSDDSITSSSSFCSRQQQ
ncbi:hypothetical protein CRENBAI_022069 [Crenichthys baileyi]|uniref:Uncharacterized protein n=1 Tax=Crenichthys baileyi TaxID=28760 RepID=A0AAV9R5U5_9TELE